MPGENPTQPAMPLHLRVAGWPQPLSQTLMHALARLCDAVEAIAQQDNVQLGPDPLGLFGGQNVCTWKCNSGEPMAPPQTIERLERAAQLMQDLLAQAENVPWDRRASRSSLTKQ
jgi:hypothetical protein